MSDKPSKGYRYCFRQDDDGHWYMLPTECVKAFERLLPKVYAETLTKNEDRQWSRMEAHRLPGGIDGISFDSPMEDPDCS